MWAEWVAWQLELAGYRVLIQAWDLVPGRHWMPLMRDGIDDTDHTVALVSTAYIESPYTRLEWQAALRADPDGAARRLIPVRVEECTPSRLLGQVMSFDLFGLEEAAAARRLLEAVAGALSGTARPRAAPLFPRGRALAAQTSARARAEEGSQPLYPGRTTYPVGAADDLAHQVQSHWTHEAYARLLYQPVPLRVRWSATSRPVSASAAGILGGAVGGRPLRLRLEGDLAGIVNTLTRLPRQQLVVLGDPGAGKSTLAIHLTLGLLAHRREHGGPVPLLVQLASWNPREEHLFSWIARQLAADHPRLADSRRERMQIALGLLDECDLIPVLDGLDEVPEELHAAALAAIDQAMGSGRPFVVTCRSSEYEAAVTSGGRVLSAAAVVELEPVTIADAVDFLGAGLAPTDDRWTTVFAALRGTPDGAPARALSTPLMISLARLAYRQPDARPADLLDRFTEQSEIEQHLLARFVPSLYARAALSAEPGRVRASGRYHPEKVYRALGLVSAVMRCGHGEFEWWEIGRVFSPAVRTWLGAFAAAVTAVVLPLALSLTTGLSAVSCYVCAGIAGVVVAAAGVPSGPRRLRTRAEMWAAVTYRQRRVVSDLRAPFLLFRRFNVPLLLASAASFASYDLLRIYYYRTESDLLAFGLIAAGVTALAVGRALVRVLRNISAETEQPFASSLIIKIGDSRDLTARQAARQDRAATFVQLAVGILLGLTTGVALAGLFGLGAWSVLYGLVAGWTLGVILAFRAATPWYLVFVCDLALRRDVPVRVVAFLEDGCGRGVVRRRGMGYEFRHALLKDYFTDEAGSELRRREARRPLASWLDRWVDSGRRSVLARIRTAGVSIADVLYYLSPQASNVLALAVLLAKERGPRKVVHPGELLCALCGVPGIERDVLLSLGVRFDEILRLIRSDEGLGLPHRGVPRGAKIPRAAVREMIRQAGDRTEPRHLLLVISEPEGWSETLWKTFDLTAGQVRQQLARALSAEPERRRPGTDPAAPDPGASRSSYTHELAHAHRLLALAKAGGSTGGQATALSNLGWYQALRGELEPAVRSCEAALSLIEQNSVAVRLMDHGLAVQTLDSLAFAHLRRGDHAAARACLDRAHKLWKASDGSPENRAVVLARLGEVEEAAGAPARAAQAWRQALAIIEQASASRFRMDVGVTANELRARLERLDHPGSPTGLGGVAVPDASAETGPRAQPDESGDQPAFPAQTPAPASVPVAPPEPTTGRRHRDWSLLTSLLVTLVPIITIVSSVTALQTVGTHPEKISTIAGDGDTSGNSVIIPVIGFFDTKPDQTGLGTPVGSAVEPNGDILIAERTAARVTVVIDNYILYFSNTDWDSSVLGSPTAVAVSADFTVYIADAENDRILKIDDQYGVPSLTDVYGRSGGDAGDRGPAADLHLNNPLGMAVDATGNLFVADSGNNRVLRIGTDGTFTTVAGTGRTGYSGDGGLATDAQLDDPAAVTVDAKGDLFVADTGNNRVRRISPDGTISTVAGTGRAGYSGDGGPADRATLDAPSGLAVDAAGDLFVADTKNNRVRRVSPTGVITTVAGTGRAGYNGDGRPARRSDLNAPVGLALDSSGNLYICDSQNNRVRRVAHAATTKP